MCKSSTCADRWSCLGFRARGGFRGRGRGRGRYFRGARQGNRDDSNSNDVSVLAKRRSSMLFAVSLVTPDCFPPFFQNGNDNQTGGEGGL